MCRMFSLPRSTWERRSLFIYLLSLLSCLISNPLRVFPLSCTGDGSSSHSQSPRSTQRPRCQYPVWVLRPVVHGDCRPLRRLRAVAYTNPALRVAEARQTLGGQPGLQRKTCFQKPKKKRSCLWSLLLLFVCLLWVCTARGLATLSWFRCLPFCPELIWSWRASLGRVPSAVRSNVESFCETTTPPISHLLVWFFILRIPFGKDVFLFVCVGVCVCRSCGGFWSSLSSPVL